MGWTTEVRFLARAGKGREGKGREFLSPPSLPDRLRAYPAVYALSIGVFRRKQSGWGREADSSPPPSAEVKVA